MKMGQIDSTTFCNFRIFDTKALRKFNQKEIEKLNQIAIIQEDNIVHGFIYASKSGRLLEGRIMCSYFITNFKEFYKQIPIIESKMGFVKRFVKQLDKYKEQLEKARKEQSEFK